jgi:hypothetical protein
MAYNAYPYQILLAQKGNYVNERINGVFYLNRSYRWKKDGSYITAAIGPSYLVSPSDVGSAITCEEAVWRTVEPNNGYAPQSPSNITYTESPPVNVIAGGSPLSGVLYPQNITYVGTFGIPPASNVSSPPGLATFQFGLYAAGLGAVGATKTLMLVGHQYECRMGHITIPSDGQLVDGFTVPIASLNRTVSSLINPTNYIAAAFEGHLDATGPASDGNGSGSNTTGSPNRGLQRVGTTNKVLMTGLHTYSNSPHGFIWRRPMDFSVTGEIEGPVAPVQIGVMENSRAVAGYMCSVAPENQAALGGDILIGVNGLSIVGATSDGPPLMSLDSSTFDAAFAKRVNGTVQAGSTTVTVKLDSSASAVPNYYVGWYIHIPDFSDVASKIQSYNEITKTVTVTGWTLVNNSVTVPPTGATYKLIPQLNGKALCIYGIDGLAVLRFDELSPIWAYNNNAVGVFQPSGSKAVLWVGISGQGSWTYNGNGELTGGDGYQGSPTYNGPKIWDPESLSRGPHQYPETVRVWAYSVDDLALVVSGSKTYSEIKPYAIWAMNIPYGQRIRSAVYDDATKRLYIIQSNETTGGAGDGIVHVYQVTV